MKWVGFPSVLEGSDIKNQCVVEMLRRQTPVWWFKCSLVIKPKS